MKQTIAPLSICGVYVTTQPAGLCRVCGADHAMTQHDWMTAHWYANHRPRFLEFVKPSLLVGTSVECVPDGDTLRFLNDELQALWLVYCFGVTTKLHIGHG